MESFTFGSPSSSLPLHFLIFSLLSSSASSSTYSEGTHVRTQMAAIALFAVALAVFSSAASATDPDMLQDVCVADLTSGSIRPHSVMTARLSSAHTELFLYSESNPFLFIICVV